MTGEKPISSCAATQPPGRMQPMNRTTSKLTSFIADLRSGGGHMGGLVKTPYHHLGAHDTVSTDHGLIPLLLGPVMKPGDVFVDVGCGKGRVLHWAAQSKQFQSVFGIELDKRVAAVVAGRFADRMDVTIIAGDALTSLPDSASLMYLWNPFDDNVMRRFRDAVIEKYSRLDTLGNLRIVYHNAMHSGVWQERACTVDPIHLPGGTHGAVVITFQAPHCSVAPMSVEPLDRLLPKKSDHTGTLAPAFYA